jgi:uncharacterized protein YqkB
MPLQLDILEIPSIFSVSMLKSIFFLILAAHTTFAQNCEVCISVLERVIESVPTKTAAAIEAQLDNFCSTAAGKDRQLCYYIDTVKRDVSQPAGSGVPASKICQRLAKKDAQVHSLLSHLFHHSFTHVFLNSTPPPPQKKGV